MRDDDIDPRVVFRHQNIVKGDFPQLIVLSNEIAETHGGNCMAPRGYKHPLYVLPFDHRGSFESGMFHWHGALTSEQTAQIAAAKQVIYDGFKAALAAGV